MYAHCDCMLKKLFVFRVHNKVLRVHKAHIINCMRAKRVRTVYVQHYAFSGIAVKESFNGKNQLCAQKNPFKIFMSKDI